MEDSDVLEDSEGFQCACFLFKSKNTLIHYFVFEISDPNPGPGSPAMSAESNAQSHDQGYTLNCESGATVTLSKIKYLLTYNAQSLQDVGQI